MTNEERLTALENELAKSRSDFQEAIDLIQFLGGSERVFQAAMLGMIQHHPNKAAIRQDLNDLIERAFVAVHFGAENEAHAQGAEAAKTLILEYLDKK